MPRDPDVKHVEIAGESNAPGGVEALQRNPVTNRATQLVIDLSDRINDQCLTQLSDGFLSQQRLLISNAAQRSG